MLSNARVKWIRQLHQKKFRSERRLFIAEGEKVVSELLSSDFQIESIYAVEDWSPTHKADVTVVSSAVLAQISALETPNKVLAIVHQPDQVTPEPLPGRNYLFLDAIRDPGNMGTIIRIADWFGIDRICCTSDCVELYNPKVVQASMGSIFRVPFSEADTAFLSRAADMRIPVYGAMLEGSSMYECSWPEGLVLVIGSESHGISEAVRACIMQYVTIPSYNLSQIKAESLNAAVATAILCAEMRRQQKKDPAVSGMKTSKQGEA
jgi:RNA methyltransferase, TrmH family